MLLVKQLWHKVTPINLRDPVPASTSLAKAINHTYFFISLEVTGSQRERYRPPISYQELNRGR